MSLLCCSVCGSESFYKKEEVKKMAQHIHELIKKIDKTNRDEVLNILAYVWNVYDRLFPEDKKALDFLAREHQLPPSINIQK